MRYRKIPVEIEAVRWEKMGDHENIVKLSNGDVPWNCPCCTRALADHGWLDTLEGKEFRVCPGDYIITGVKGELYPCKPEIFEMTYEKVEQ